MILDEYEDLLHTYFGTTEKTNGMVVAYNNNSYKIVVGDKYFGHFIQINHPSINNNWLSIENKLENISFRAAGFLDVDIPIEAFKLWVNNLTNNSRNNFKHDLSVPLHNILSAWKSNELMTTHMDNLEQLLTDNSIVENIPILDQFKHIFEKEQNVDRIQSNNGKQIVISLNNNNVISIWCSNVSYQFLVTSAKQISYMVSYSPLSPYSIRFATSNSIDFEMPMEIFQLFVSKICDNDTNLVKNNNPELPTLASNMLNAWQKGMLISNYMDELEKIFKKENE